MLGREFVHSVSNCLAGASAKKERWRTALRTLESDPISNDAAVAELAELHSAELEVRCPSGKAA